MSSEGYKEMLKKKCKGMLVSRDTYITKKRMVPVCRISRNADKPTHNKSWYYVKAFFLHCGGYRGLFNGI